MPWARNKFAIAAFGLAGGLALSGCDTADPPPPDAPTLTEREALRDAAAMIEARPLPAETRDPAGQGPADTNEETSE